MAKISSLFEQMRASIKKDKDAVTDVARAALDGAADFDTESDIEPVKDQKWVAEVEATGPKRK